MVGAGTPRYKGLDFYPPQNIRATGEMIQFLVGVAHRLRVWRNRGRVLRAGSVGPNAARAVRMGGRSGIFGRVVLWFDQPDLQLFAIRTPEVTSSAMPYPQRVVAIKEQSFG